LLERSAPLAGFSSATREPRGADAGDLVDSAVESRAILEKTKALDARMRYQIQKLVRVAEDTDTRNQDITHGRWNSQVVAQNISS
jgi:U3 small nucleolar ribonucleoprotein protein LCP5